MAAKTPTSVPTNMRERPVRRILGLPDPFLDVMVVSSSNEDVGSGEGGLKGAGSKVVDSKEVGSGEKGMSSDGCGLKGSLSTVGASL